MPGVGAGTVALRDPAARDASVVGAKAAHLAELVAAGHRVPDGLVLPVSLLVQWRSGSAPPAAVARAVRQIVDAFDGVPLAVRSSADAEDGVAASFAGAYTTVLGAQGVEDVTAAVRACLDSADAARLLTYRGTGGVRMAVLCQPMLDPDAAGVAFTADPVSGDPEVAHVSAVRGLGDRLGEGTARPEEWRVVAGVAERAETGAEAALTVEQALAVAATARATADLVGRPCDIEWAITGGQVHLLQCRPISALPVPPADRLDGTGWEKDVAHYTELVTPFGWSLFGPSVTSAMETMSRDFGLLMAGLDQVSIGGEVYVRQVPVLGSPEPTGLTPPALLVGLAARVVPTLRARLRAARQAVTSDAAGQRLAAWEQHWRADFVQRTQAMLAENLAGLDDAGMLDHLERAAALLHDGHHAHFQLYMPYTLALYDLVVTCQELLGWDTHDTMRLMVGCSPASVDGTQALGAIRAEISPRPELTDALLSAPADPVAALQGVDGEAAQRLAQRLAEWMQAHAWRATNYDPGSPAVIERPGVITRLLLHDPSPSDIEHSPSAEAEARRRLDASGAARFSAALEHARRVYPVREENVALTDNIPCGILRRWVIEAGRRLVERGRLSRVEDAVYCTADELSASLRGDGVDPAAAAARRRGEQAWTRAHPGPAVVGNLDDPPDLRWLPRHGRRMNEAVAWGLQMEFPGVMARSGDHELRGTPGSPGAYTGSVRVVRGEADFGTLFPGEVLVCPSTAPAWTTLFAMAGALVTDAGGPLAHAAIIAREYGLPAVVGTVEATSKLTTGDLVTVDGTSGTITKHPRNQATDPYNSVATSPRRASATTR